MPMGDKYDPIASIVNSIDNISKQFMEYQQEKQKRAVDFAKSIDQLIALTKQRAIKTTEIANIKKELEDKFMNTMDTEIVYNGLVSTSAGLDREFLLASTTYLRQKDFEKNKDLTKLYTQDVRDAFLVRAAQDAKQWDSEFREMIKKSLTLIQNVAIGFRPDRQQMEHGNQGEQTEERKPSAKTTSKAEEYNME